MHSYCKHPPQEGFSLQAANGSSIPTYGRQSLTLNLGLRHTFPWIFIIANVHQPIIGADFLNHFNLLVDLRTSDFLTVTPTSTFRAIIHLSVQSGALLMVTQSITPF